MAKQTREERRAEEERKTAEAVAYDRTFLSRGVLLQLARADKLGLQYRVSHVKSDITEYPAIQITISAARHDLGYADCESIMLYHHPIPEHHTPSYHIDSLINLNDRVEAYREEQERLAAVKKAALEKLTDDEKKALGLR